MSKVNDMTPATGAKTSWNTRSGFVLATIGSAVGIGSIWKFPYEVGANGGGAFVLVYIVGLSLVVVPLMLAEFALGRRGRSDAPTSIAAVAVSAGATRRWGSVGVLGAVTSFVILSFYSVIGGWALSYAGDTAISLTAGLTIFPVVFANDLDPASGPGLAFVSLPLAFEACRADAGKSLLPPSQMITSASFSAILSTSA